MTQTKNSSLAEQSFILHPSPLILYSTIVKLSAIQPGTIPATQGRLANAAFLDIIKTIDPVLSQTIHDLKGRKPFTVSPLRKLGRPHNGQITLRAGHAPWLRFTLLDAQLFTTLTQYMLSGNHAYPTIRIGEVDFAVTEMLTTPGSHPWAGYTTLEELHRRRQISAPDPSHHKIIIQFASPTVFSLGDKKDGLGKRMEPFPTPALFFGGLASIWKTQLPPAVTPKLVQEYAAETVVVGLYQMRSKVYRFWKQPQIGAEGTMTYILRDKAHPQMTQLLNLLVDLGFYSGVGYKTAMGMGQIRRLVLSEGSEAAEAEGMKAEG